MSNKFRAIWAGFFLVVISLFAAVQYQWSSTVENAKKSYVEASHFEATSNLNNLEIGVRSIYQNIRTLASLPSVRRIDRHGANLGQESFVTFQQIYNNLASDVAVSEVYILPIDFDPEKLDPVTMKKEEPILMFDELITDSKKGLTVAPSSTESTKILQSPIPAASELEEVEIHEYRQLVDHATWLKKQYPTNANVKALDMPFISGPEVLTCDNSRYALTHKDSSRSGIMFSVPFFSQDGKIRGMISAIILTDALRDLLPSKYFGLVNPGNQYLNLGEGLMEMTDSQEAIKNNQPDKNLIYSEVIPLGVIDSRNPWYVWSGLPNSFFENSQPIQAANHARALSYLALVLLTLISALAIYLTQRNFKTNALMHHSLLESKLIAEKSARDAEEFSDGMKEVNDRVAQLNTELSNKIQELNDAHLDIISKGKMAQLGNLIATVAHELRNPLGGVRTTAFMLQRKLKDSPIDVAPQLQRIEAGVKRCDNIISQLLDYSRTQALSLSQVEMGGWLQTLLEEEAAKLPAAVELQCELTEDPLNINIDGERLRRGVINMVNNAAEALTTKSSNPEAVLPANPVIKISLVKTNTGAEIVVEDNGPGIPAELISKIGDPLFTTKSFGTGLGVAAVKKIAELHGGDLIITSPPGMGAKFRLCIRNQALESIVA